MSDLPLSLTPTIRPSYCCLLFSLTANQSPLRVSVVDPNPVQRQLLSDVLGTLGYEVQAIAHAKDAIAGLEAFQPAIVLLNRQEDSMDMLSLLDAIADQRPWQFLAVDIAFVLSLPSA